jgi:TPR repeat protein
MNEVIRMWRLAADHGHAAAHFNLGVMYEKGQRVKQDHGGAVRWFRKSADPGHAAAQFNLGVMFANGRGVKQDHGDALAWFRKSAAQGNAQAKEGVLLVEGELRKQQQAAPPEAAERMSPATLSPQTCANCGIAEMAGSAALKPCSRCKDAVYCGKACQAQHWKAGGHREKCTRPKEASLPQASPDGSSSGGAGASNFFPLSYFCVLRARFYGRLMRLASVWEKRSHSARTSAGGRSFFSQIGNPRRACSV